MGLHAKIMIASICFLLCMMFVSWGSLSLLVTLLILLVLAAFFVWYMHILVIQPIIALLKVTDQITEGKYEEAHTPPVSRRKDEIALLVQSFNHLLLGIHEKEKMRALLAKVVSKEIAEEILRHPPHLGGEDRVVTMLFSDIRDFTTLTHDISPQKTIEMLNFYMTKMARVIEHEGGLVDKFVGDEIMALFGAPVAHPQHALRAISTGLLMIKLVKKINEERRHAGDPFFEMGIAIHTGVVVAGNMGAEDRLNYTVLGRNVNTAARLCHVAKPGQLIISEATLQEPGVKEAFSTSPLEPVLLKGISEPVSIYEVRSFQW